MTRRALAWRAKSAKLVTVGCPVTAAACSNVFLKSRGILASSRAVAGIRERDFAAKAAMDGLSGNLPGPATIKLFDRRSAELESVLPSSRNLPANVRRKRE